MPVYKDEKRNTWFIKTRYKSWKNEVKWLTKRGFQTKREALAWERAFLEQQAGDVEMRFGNFVELYERDRRPRLKLSTWMTKEHIIETKILPYFRDFRLCDITAAEIVNWQNGLLTHRDAQTGKPYSPVYLKTIHNQMSALLNHAVRFYRLKGNTARDAGNIGSKNGAKIKIWTLEQYRCFSDAMMENPLAYYCFEVLYWCGIREGELLALTQEDFNFGAGTLSISKTYHRANGQDYITEPKTPNSNREIIMPEFLCTEMQEYFSMCCDSAEGERAFPVSKNFLRNHLIAGAKKCGLPQIRIHDLQHSHECRSLGYF